MRTTNRGDVPAPHVPPGQGEGGVVEDVVFDAGSLSFVQDWVADGGDSGGAAAAAAAADVEPAREDPRKSNPNRRLGVGAQPKKPKPERPEPSALEKKMLRKRQRQELSDAIAGEMDTHGVVNDDEEKDGESKTASFKKSKTKKTQSAPIEQDTTTIAIAPAPAPAPGKDKRGGGKSGTEDAVSTREGEGIAEKSGDNEDGEKQGRKRKAKRKKNKGAAKEAATEVAEVAAADGETPSQGPAPAVEDGSSEALKTATADDGENAAEVTAVESKKQRRGWGKARSKATVAAAAAASADGTPSNSATDGGGRNGTGAHERRQRKKTRSKQKNIRKDKRPMEQRPAYVRAGDPEFCGRGLTDETRKFLGLPELKDFGDAPPAGWGQPGQPGAKPGWVIDKKPRRLPKDLVPDAAPIVEEGERRGAETGVAAPVASVKGAASSAVSSKSKSKYKNLTLPPGTKADKKRGKKTERSSIGGDGESRKLKGKSKEAP